MVRRNGMGFSRDLRSIGAAIVVCASASQLMACATLAGGGGGDVDLPNAAAGPFRELKEGELIKISTTDGSYMGRA